LDEYIQANLMTTANILMAANEAGVKFFVHTSSPSVVHSGQPLDGADESVPLARNPAHAYPYSKMLAERLVLAGDQPGFRTVALRPHLIWGPGDPHFLPRLWEQAKKNKLWLLKSEALVDGVYVDNAAASHVLALEKLSAGAPVGGRAYFITQGEPMTVYELIDKIVKALPPRGSLGVRGQCPARAGKLMAGLLEAVWKLFKLSGEPPITSFVAEEMTLPHWFRLDAARRDLGYAPLVSVAEGLERLAEYYR
jgi:nucleoside-diphosphate-sugar epimerase